MLSGRYTSCMPRFLRSIIIAVMFFINGVTNAQNLIADSSFEFNNGVPLLLSSIGLNSSWSSPNRATPDLFCECNKKLAEKSEANVPINPFGVQKPNNGKCYAGIYAFSHGDYREYLQTQLNEPLRGGQKYELYFWISLADWSRVAVHQIGAVFLGGKAPYTTSDDITGVKTVYATLQYDVGMDNVLWHQIIIPYKARGGESVLILGTFDVWDIYETGVRPPKGVRTKINQKTERDGYYYIDDVSLREYQEPYVAKFDTVVVPKIDILPATVITHNEEPDKPVEEVVLEKPIILNNVLFESGKAKLLSESNQELDAVAEYLITNKDLKIEVSGHTDNVGNAKQNLILSEKRAKAVADYFITLSIDPARISYKGFGSEKPIAPNDTEDGRKQNRRVELVYLKK